MKIAILLLIGSLAMVWAGAASTLKLTQTISLPEVKGRFDHFAIDVKGRRLFLAALGNNSLEVFDLASNKHLQSIPGMSKPTGVLFWGESNHIFVANGDDGTLKILDGTSFQVLKSTGSLPDADNLRYESKTGLAYLGYGEGALGIIAMASGKEIGTVQLPKHPESFQLEQNGQRIFVNVPDAKEVAVIDREKRRVVESWPMNDYQANFPMALDEANRRLFIGCRKPPRLVVLDTQSGKPVTDLAISGDTDDLFYDAVRKRLYLSCGEGYIDVMDQISPDRCQLRERIPTRPGARTSFSRGTLNAFYLAVPERREQSAELRIFSVLD